MDIKADSIQRMHDFAFTALAGEDSFTSTMNTAGMVIPIDKSRGAYRLKSLDVYNSLPVWTWNQIVNL